MDSKEKELVKVFNNELTSLYDTPPPISKAKMTQITKSALKAIKCYKHVVQSVEKFIQKCKAEYKIPGLYVVDSIVRQSRHQFGAEKDLFGPRFVRNMCTLFLNLFKCPSGDLEKVRKVLILWQKNNVFANEIIVPLLELASDPNNQQILTKAQKAVEIYLAARDAAKYAGKTADEYQPGDELSIEPMEVEMTDVNPANSENIVASLHQLFQSLQQQPNSSTASTTLVELKDIFDKNYAALKSTPCVDVAMLDRMKGQIHSRLVQPEQAQTKKAILTGYDYGDSDSGDDSTDLKNNMSQLVNDLQKAQEVVVMEESPASQQSDSEQSTQPSFYQQTQQQQSAYVPQPGFGYIAPPTTTPTAPVTGGFGTFSYNQMQQQPAPTPPQPQSLPVYQQAALPLQRDRSNSRERHHRRSRSRSRSRERRGGRRRHSKERGGGGGGRHRRHRSGSGDRRGGDFEDREFDRNRRKLGLPPVKFGKVCVCSRTIWIGHLSKHTHEDELKNECEKYGTVHSINLITPRGCAYVVYTERKSAAEAVERLKAFRFIGLALRTDWAPGIGIKDPPFSQYWDPKHGCAYIPWEKLPPKMMPLAEGGYIDRSTLNDDRRCLIQQELSLMLDDPEEATATAPPAPVVANYPQHQQQQPHPQQHMVHQPQQQMPQTVQHPPMHHQQQHHHQQQMQHIPQASITQTFASHQHPAHQMVTTTSVTSAAPMTANSFFSSNPQVPLSQLPMAAGGNAVVMNAAANPMQLVRNPSMAAQPQLVRIPMGGGGVLGMPSLAGGGISGLGMAAAGLHPMLRMGGVGLGGVPGLSTSLSSLMQQQQSVVAAVAAATAASAPIIKPEETATIPGTVSITELPPSPKLEEVKEEQLQPPPTTQSNERANMFEAPVKEESLSNQSFPPPIQQPGPDHQTHQMPQQQQQPPLLPTPQQQPPQQQPPIHMQPPPEQQQQQLPPQMQQMPPPHHDFPMEQQQSHQQQFSNNGADMQMDQQMQHNSQMPPYGNDQMSQPLMGGSDGPPPGWNGPPPGGFRGGPGPPFRGPPGCDFRGGPPPGGDYRGPFRPDFRGGPPGGWVGPPQFRGQRPPPNWRPGPGGPPGRGHGPPPPRGHHGPPPPFNMRFRGGPPMQRGPRPIFDDGDMFEEPMMDKQGGVSAPSGATPPPSQQLPTNGASNDFVEDC